MQKNIEKAKLLSADENLQTDAKTERNDGILHTAATNLWTISLILSLCLNFTLICFLASQEKQHENITSPQRSEYGQIVLTFFRHLSIGI